MSGAARLVLVVLALAVLGGGLWRWRGEGAAPRLEGPPEAAVGRAPQVMALELSDEGAGLRAVEVTLVHARGEARLLERGFAGDPVFGGGPGHEWVDFEIDAEALGLPEGGAVLHVSVRDWSWRGLFAGNETRVEIPVAVDLTPPRVTVESGLTYVRRGGAAAVVYRVGERPLRDGVLVGDLFYGGIPWEQPGADCAPLSRAAGLDAGAGESSCRLALFAVPVDAPANPEIRVRVEDRAGNATVRSWAVRVQERGFPEVPVRLPPSFLERKVRALARDLGLDPSDPLEAFKAINSGVRAQNEATIREIAGGPPGAPLWEGPFLQLPNSKVTRRFAERRRYLAGGEAVARATHFGFDLASTAHARVPAANTGRVIFAGDLGIYGDSVLIDHGLGLVSLYGHLSRIDVEAGESVRQGEILGLSGQTGLAGGDHLHFAILVGSTYTDPREWWDPKWVREHVDLRMGR